MKKYWFIFKTQVMTNIQYIGNIIFSFIGNFILLFILFNLWNYLYSDPNEVINGYTKAQMIWYVIVTEYLWMVIGGRRLTRKISEEVKSGGITYKLNKPYDYVKYCLFDHLGDVFVKAIIFLILFMGMGFIFVGHFPDLNIMSILIVALTCIIATTISALMLISLGLLAFFIEDSGPLYWIYSKFILVLGTIFPIEYFPKVLQKILKFTPVFVVSYGPAKLFVNFSYQSALVILGAQVIYLTIAYLLCSFIYKKGVKNINVNGG